MLDTPVARALAAQIKKAQLVYVMLLSSLLVYLVMGYQLTLQRETPGSEASLGLLAPILGAVGLATLVASFLLRGTLLRKALADLPAEITEERVGDVASAAFTPWILGWALCEAVAIYGLILFVLTFRWELFLPFWGAGLVGLLLQAPTLRSLESALERR
ncbi:MAG TPA: hypothetical protein VNM90_24530 [Haliangium sp.]|nr:hypothetical protein [Haliangium sp.]